MLVVAQGSYCMQGSQGTHMGACSTHMLGWTIGWTIGGPIAMGALSIAGADITVPHGEPLWNKFRHRLQPEVDAARAATASKIVSFLMGGISAAGAKVGRATARVGRGGRPGLQEGGTGGKQLYPTADDVQTQRAIFFCIVAATWALKKCYACAGRECALRCGA